MKLADRKPFFPALLLAVLTGALGYSAISFIIGPMLKLEIESELLVLILFIYGPFLYTSITSIFLSKKLTFKQTIFLSILSQVIIFVLFVLFGPDGVFTDSYICGYFFGPVNSQQWVHQFSLECISEQLLAWGQLFYLELLGFVFIAVPIVFKYFFDNRKKSAKIT